MCTRKCFDQYFECRGLFSVSEATSRATDEVHLLKFNDWYPKHSHKILGQFNQYCECPGKFSVLEAISRASYEVHF